MASLLHKAGSQAGNGRRWNADLAAAEGQRIGAAAQRKATREQVAESQAWHESHQRDRAVTWQRVISVDGEPRIVRMRADAGAYDDRGIASLAARAAREAAATARKGRQVRNGQRIAKVALSESELESLTAEVALLILETRDERRRRENRMPKAGQVAEKLATGKLAAAIEAGNVSGYRADLEACRAKALDLIRADGANQEWRDCADAVRRAGAEQTDLVMTGESHSIMSEAEGQASTAYSDPYLIHGAGRHPVNPDSQATLYLSGLGKRQRLAIEAALTVGRATAADLAESSGTASANAYRVAISKGRAALRDAMADPARRSVLARQLQEIAESEDGPRREGEPVPSIMREGGAMGREATRLARESVLAGSPTDAEAADMVRVYLTDSRRGRVLETLTRDLRAARRKVSALVKATDPDASGEVLEAARQRVAALAAAHRAERHRCAITA